MRTPVIEVPMGEGLLPGLKEVLKRYHKRTSVTHKRLVLAIVLVGIALRGWMLTLPITADEAFMWAHYATRPVGEIIGDLSHPQNHVLHTLLVKWSTLLLGPGIIALRLPAFLAGVFTMPLFYLFVRAMFNRYIAVMTLALVAASGGLIELGTVASGHAITWFFFVTALVFGRYFHKTNDPMAAFGMGACLALGMWAGPSGLYPALMVLLWSLLHLLTRHSDTLQVRMRHWFLALGTALGLVLVLFAPIINNHGILQVVHHDSLPDMQWKKFSRTHVEGAMALWFHLVDMGSRWFAVVGLAGLVVAAYISGKYRAMALAMLVGAVLPVLLILYVPGPEAWSYTLYIMHISTAIVLFYLLKFLQEKMFPGLGKRTRVAVASVLMLVGTGWPAMNFLLGTDRLSRFPEAMSAASFLDEAMDPEDRVYAEPPWEDPLLFHLMCHGWGKGVMRGLGPPGKRIYVVVDPGSDQSVEDVLEAQAVPAGRSEGMRLVAEHGRLKVHAARVIAP